MATLVTRPNGKRCTAVPKKGFKAAEAANPTSSSSTSTSISFSTSTTSTSISASSSSSSSSTSISAPELPLSSSSTSISIPTQAPTPTAVNAGESPQPQQDSTSNPISTTSVFAITNVATSPNQDAVPNITDSSTPPETTANTSTAETDSSSTTPLVQSTSSTQTPDGTVDNTSTPTLISTDLSTSIVSTGDVGSLTIGTSASSQTTSSLLESSTGTAGLSSSEPPVTSNAVNTQQTAAIAGGVVGGIVFISLAAFLLWLWRKRRMQEKKSQLLTPLSPSGEKGAYFISRTSVGPTPFAEKLWAVAGTKYRKLRGRVNDAVARSDSPSPSVNLDRGNSQFGAPEPMHSRNNSGTKAVIGKTSTSQDRPVDWWGRLAEDENSNWHIRDESKTNTMGNASLAVSRATTEGNKPQIGSQPDFLTLLNMDDKQLEREAAMKGRNSVNGKQRRSVSMGGEQHFLGGLDLNFDSANPFSDVNAVSTNTAKAIPLVVSAANNPFSDANAITIPPSSSANGGLAAYAQNVRRSRGHSMNGSISRQPSNASTYYRKSNMSMETVGTRRTKFRSDPFDLDRPDFLQNAHASTDVLPGGPSSRTSRASRSIAGLPNTPRQAHVRAESFTSKYSSGVSNVSSMGQWSEPGPDVGPAITRFTPSPDSALGRRDTDEKRRNGGSQGSVGKAM